jgi:hypothetical protein
MMEYQVLSANVHQSKWGYHPCDHETFLKYKQLYALALADWKRAKAFWRYWRKQPQNRFAKGVVRSMDGRPIATIKGAPLPEPREPYFCPNVLRADGEWVLQKDIQTFYYIHRDRDHRPAAPHELLLADYRTARMPYSDPKEAGMAFFYHRASVLDGMLKAYREAADR